MSLWCLPHCSLSFQSMPSLRIRLPPICIKILLLIRMQSIKRHCHSRACWLTPWGPSNYIKMIMESKHLESSVGSEFLLFCYGEYFSYFSSTESKQLSMTLTTKVKLHLIILCTSRTCPKIWVPNNYKNS